MGKKNEHINENTILIILKHLLLPWDEAAGDGIPQLQ